MARGERGGDLFECGVAGALADAVDGALDLTRAAVDAGERVGDGHAEVVVAVRGEDDRVGVGDVGANFFEERLVLGGRGVADGVRDVDGGGAGLDGDVDHLDEEVDVGAGAVLGGELDVVGVAAGEANALADLVDGLGARDAELGLEVQVGGGEEGVDAVLLRGLNGTGGGLDVLALAAGERGDAGAADLFGDCVDGVEVALRGDGKAGFDDVDAQRGELVRHTELLVVVHGAAGRLLAVAEGGVKEDDLVGECHGR